MVKYIFLFGVHFDKYQRYKRNKLICEFRTQGMMYKKYKINV